MPNQILNRRVVLARVASAVVIDADAQAFFTAAGITDAGQKSALNTLVIALKSDGIWAKLPAIYPYVGGSAAAHKLNLKDPQDTDGAFRLTFTGGWTHSATGALPDGSTGYADTHFEPFTVGLTYDNNSISCYSRTNVTSVFESGCQTNVLNGFGLYLRRAGDTAGYDASGTANRNTFSNADGRGFYTGTAVSATSLFFKNGVQQSTLPGLTNQPFSSLPVYLGAFNEVGTANYFSSKERAFDALGLGLTAGEAANFYTRVQAFQTALGRAV